MVLVFTKLTLTDLLIYDTRKTLHTAKNIHLIKLFILYYIFY